MYTDVFLTRSSFSFDVVRTQSHSGQQCSHPAHCQPHRSNKGGVSGSTKASTSQHKEQDEKVAIVSQKKTKLVQASAYKPTLVVSILGMSVGFSVQRCPISVASIGSRKAWPTKEEKASHKQKPLLGDHSFGHGRNMLHATSARVPP